MKLMTKIHSFLLFFSGAAALLLSLPSFTGTFTASAQISQVAGAVAKSAAKKIGTDELMNIGKTLINKYNLSTDEASVVNSVISEHSQELLSGLVGQAQIEIWFHDEMLKQGLLGAVEETALPQIIAHLNVLENLQNSASGEYINRFASVLSNLESMGSRIESLDRAFQATVTASSLFDNTNILQDLYSSYQTARSIISQAGALIEGADNIESFNDAYSYATRVMAINNSLFNEFERLYSILSKKNVSNDKKLTEVKEMNKVIEDLMNELNTAKADILLNQYNNITGVKPLMTSIAEMRYGDYSLSATSLPEVSSDAIRKKVYEDQIAEDVESTRRTLKGFFEPMLNIASILAAIIFAVLAIFAYYRSNDIEKQHHNAFYKLITGGLITVALLQVIRIIFSAIFRTP